MLERLKKFFTAETSRPAIVIKTAEGQWPDGFRTLKGRDPVRYAEQVEKLRKAGIKVPDHDR